MAAEFVQNEISSHNVTIFSKSYCPYCAATKKLFLQDLAASDVVVHELDKMSNGSEIQSELHSKTGQRTVPSVWVKAKFVGGNDDTQKAFRDGSLQQMLAA